MFDKPRTRFALSPRNNLRDSLREFIKDTSRNPLKARWQRWKCAQNAHILRVCSAFSHISALPSRLDRIFRGALKYPG